MRVRMTVVQGRSAPRIIEIEASGPEDARQRAESDGYTVLDARAEGMMARRRVRGGQPFDVPVFVGQLRDLLGAGLSVIEALDALKRGARGSTRQVIEDMERQLREGRTLSAAMAAAPRIPSLLVALVRSAELTSDLPRSLTRFIEHEQRVAEVRHRIVSASIYPLLVTGVGGLVMLFLTFYVVPRFSRVFEGLSGDLPWSARLMVAWAHSLDDHRAVWLLLLLALAALGSCVVMSRSLRAALVRRAFAWGPLREQLALYFLARWYHATGMLVQGGIPLSQALKLTGSLLPAALQPQAAQVEEGIRSGLSPSVAHARAGMATPVAEQLLLAGERTGDLGAVLSRIAHYHESEVSRTLERAMRVLEPVVMVVIGLGVGLVVVLMYMPIFELASAIS